MENEDDEDDAIMFNWNEEVSDPGEHISTPTPSSNYGKRVNGPWKVGLYLDKKHIRFVEVRDETAETLNHVTKNHVKDGSVIVTDK